ncbi:hypothetical protein C0Q70_12078 [Pomacea canaliculata]|uniref:Uncharacterized protein n=1 Tax=Pomacea canaliculata TaxID=400727 RepID=A0A2T7P0I4_POMCA|nr:hypothetical protein C0Q70_12078 [Pomacea canaliculata]
MLCVELFLSTKAGNGAGPVSERGTDGLTNPLSILVTPDLAWISPHQSSSGPLHANCSDVDDHAKHGPDIINPPLPSPPPPPPPPPPSSVLRPTGISSVQEAADQ